MERKRSGGDGLLITAPRPSREDPKVMGKHRPSHLKLAVLKAFRQRRAAKENFFEDVDATFRLRTPDHGRLKNFILFHAV